MSEGSDLRIGQGFDVHRFVEGRKLFLGGIEIAHERGLEGHSDADVLLHALTDAILGALAWGDIGSWFPNDAEEYRNIDSKLLLSRVWEKVSEDGWVLQNADCTVLLERPKLRPHVESICETIAELLVASPEQVSVKATTCEKMGSIGREEGIAAFAVVLLAKAS